MAEPAAQAQASEDPLDKLQQARERLLTEHGHLVGEQADARPSGPDGAQASEQPVQPTANSQAGAMQETAQAAVGQQIDLAAWVNTLYQLDQTNLQTILRYLPAQQLALALYGIVSAPVAENTAPACAPAASAETDQQTTQAEKAADAGQPVESAQPLQAEPDIEHQKAGDTWQPAAAAQPNEALQHDTPAEPMADEQAVDDVEERQAERHRTLRAGKIIFNNKMSVTDCKIRDISQTGCRLDLQSVIALPRCFTLHIVNGNSYHECEVMWRKDTQMGVQFIG